MRIHKFKIIEFTASLNVIFIYWKWFMKWEAELQLFHSFFKEWKQCCHLQSLIHCLLYAVEWKSSFLYENLLLHLLTTILTKFCCVVVFKTTFWKIHYLVPAQISVFALKCFTVYAISCQLLSLLNCCPL